MPIESVTWWLINSFSYLGVFVAAIIVSSSIFFPLPGPLVILFATAMKLNPFLVSIAASAGSMIGELTGYYTGLIGSEVAEKTIRKYKKIEKFIRRYFKKYASPIILIAALLPFPFDIIGIIAGATRYNVIKFLIIGFIGKFFKTYILFMVLKYGITLITTIW